MFLSQYKSLEIHRSKVVTCSCDENWSDQVFFFAEVQLFKIGWSIYIYIYLRFTNTHHLQSQLQKIKPGKQTLRQRKPSWCSDRNWSICDTTGVVPNCWMLRPAVLKAINGLLGVFSKGRTCQSCCPRVHLIGLSFTQSHWFIPIQQHHRLD